MDLNIYDERLSKQAVIKIASSALGVQELLDRLNRIGDDSVVQVFDTDFIINKTHLLGAYLNAVMAFKERRNIAKSASMEMLLFAAMTTQIEDAIRIVGIKSPSGFVLFADKPGSYEKIRKFLTKEHDFLPTRKHIKDAASRFGILEDYDKNILSKMALSRL